MTAAFPFTTRRSGEERLENNLLETHLELWGQRSVGSHAIMVMAANSPSGQCCQPFSDPTAPDGLVW